MTTVSLSKRDINVLEKIRDPEFDPSTSARIDSAATVDPHVTDPVAYRHVATREREIVSRMQQAELELENSQNLKATCETYTKAVSELGQLIAEYPRYASVRNNRAQALRRLYGDAMASTWKGAAPIEPSSQGLVQDLSEEERTRISANVLEDLDEAIALLTPPSSWIPISPTTARTLASAHTQRAAVYHATSKMFHRNHSLASQDRREAKWTAVEFETAASRDFALGARYGNEIARGLAVSINPTAKLCGQMVQEMMRREYGDDGA